MACKIFHFMYGMSSQPHLAIDELHHFSRWAHCTTLTNSIIFQDGYPLVICYIATSIENGTFIVDLPNHWKWWFSIVMLVYQRVKHVKTTNQSFFESQIWHCIPPTAAMYTSEITTATGTCGCGVAHEVMGYAEGTVTPYFGWFSIHKWTSFLGCVYQSATG